MEKFIHRIGSKPLLVMLFLLVGTAVFIRGVFLLEFEADVIQSDLPQSSSAFRDENYIREVFGNQEIVLVAVEYDDLLRKETLEKVRAIGERLGKVQGVEQESVASIATVSDIQRVEGRVVIEPLLGEFPQDENDQEALRERIESNPFVWGRLVSRDFSSALIIARLENRYEPEDVAAEMHRIAADFAGPEEVYLSGRPIVSRDLNTSIRADMMKLFPLALLAVSVVFFLGFRSLRLVAVPFAVMVLSVIWTLGLVGYLGIAITPLVSAMPIVIIALGSSYAIHLVLRYQEEVRQGESRERALRNTIRTISFPIIVAGLTSAIGFVTLFVFQINSIRQFGIFTAVGIVFTVFISLLVIPMALSMFRINGAQSNQSRAARFLEGALDWFLILITRWSIQRKLLTSLVIGGVLICGIIGLTRLTVGFDPYELFPKGHRSVRTEQFLREHFSSTGKVSVVVEGISRSDLDDPDFLARLADFERQIGEIPGVGYVSSYRAILSQIMAALGYEADPSGWDPDVARFVFVEMEGRGLLDSFVDESGSTVKVDLFLTTLHTSDISHVRSEAENIARVTLGSDVELRFGGQGMLLLAFDEYIVTGKIINILVTLGITVAVVGLVLRSLWYGPLSVIPLIAATFFTFGLMGWLGISLNLATAVISGIAVGVGVDFAIHYLFRYRENKRLYSGNKLFLETARSAGRPILFDSLTNIAGFSVFLFSGFASLSQLGFLMIVIMIGSAFGTLVLYPLILSRNKT